MRKNLLFALCMLIPTVIDAQDRIQFQTGTWTGKTITIDGEVVPNGYGTYEFSWGDKFIGTMTNGEITGKGEYYFSDGNVYKGEFKDRKRNGYGVQTWNTGEKYEGFWQNDFAHGKGTKFYANGAKFIGNFMYNKANGMGTMYYKDGSKNVGQWVDNELNGECEQYFANGGYYSGTMKKNKRHGFGRYEYSNGKVYVGEWKDGKKDGYGTMHYTPDDYYEGTFLKGKKHGDGVLYFNNGDYIVGTWEKDSLIHTEYKYVCPKEVAKEYAEYISNETSKKTVNTSTTETQNNSSYNPIMYNGHSVLPINQMMYMDPMDVINYCNQFPGGINILLDPNFAIMQVQQQMQAQQMQQMQMQNYLMQRAPEVQKAMMEGINILNERQRQYQNHLDQASAQFQAELMARVNAEQENFIKNYMNFNPGSTPEQAMDAYTNYTSGISALRTETYKQDRDNYSHEYKKTGSVKSAGETLEYVSVNGLPDIVYCKKCNDLLPRHYHKKHTYYSPW